MSMKEDLIVQTKSITKVFPGVVALKSVDFKCRRGEIHALLGENGAGKSTLIKILSGVYVQEKGEILLENELMSFKSPHDAQVKGIGVIHQELILVPYMSVAENIFLGQEQRNKYRFINTARMNEKAREILSSIGSNLNPSDIVAGLDSTNQKLVQIAKSLVKEPRILIVDEPTAPLGAKEVADFFAALRRLKAKGTTIIYISHHLEEIFEIADRLTVLKDGQNVTTVDVADTNIDEVIRFMIGRELGDLFPEKTAEKRIGTTILEVKKLNRGNVLFDIDFNLKSGEILGIAGLEGNGQDTLLRAVCGCFAKDSGEIYIEGTKIDISDPTDAIKAGIVLVTDKRHDEGLCLQLSVADNLVLSTLGKRQTAGVIDRKKERALVDKNIGEFSIKTPSGDRQAKFLSGGNQQKIVIGKWLNNDPKIIFMMEPTLGVDVGAKAEIYQFARKLADSEGKGVVMVTSDMLELLGLCDRILVMHKGRLVKELSRDEATEEKILKAAVGVN